MNQTTPPPKDGLEGMKQNFSQDLTSGFVVFLLALPLSLGIASASEFPPVMGVLTAIFGGLLATFFSGSQLSIKGPAAGLIVIVAQAVTEFGGGTEGWKLALGVMMVAGVLQIVFGLLKWGKFIDIFPLSAVHGMLAAIGLIIIAKQVPVLLNADISLAYGPGPLALIASIPKFIANLDGQVSIIGFGSLIIMFGWGFVKHEKLKIIPAPLLVLIFAIPAGMILNLGVDKPDSLVKVGNITEQLEIHASAKGVSQIGTFLKFLIMVAIVGSLESSLTVKAIDMLDPWKRKSDPNKDLIAIGVANTFAGLLGGLPMISEVARSSANVAQGGRTRAYKLLELIPNAALAAMLIAVGFKLAHPKEFRHMLQVGPEQLAIFVTTIFATLLKDLLVGIAAGMALKVIIHLFRGAKFGSLWKAGLSVDEKDDEFVVKFGQSAVFTNFLGIKAELEKLPKDKTIQFDVSDTALIDHSVMSDLSYFQKECEAAGGKVSFIGLDEMKPVSSYSTAARVRK